jgi:hypothetical protein
MRILKLLSAAPNAAHWTIEKGFVQISEIKLVQKLIGLVYF